MEDRFEKGLALRRKVLGDAHVDRSLKARDEFTTDVQQIITEIGWARSGTDRASPCASAAWPRCRSSSR